MTHDDVLNLLGFPSGSWAVFEPAKAERYLQYKDSKSNMLPIKDRKVLASLGDGYYIVNKKWVFDTIDNIDAGTQQKAENITANAPSVSGAMIPPPPSEPEVPVPPPSINVPSPPSAENEIQEAEIIKDENSFICDKYNNTGEVCETQCKVCNEREHGTIAVNENVVPENDERFNKRVKRMEEYGFKISENGHEYHNGALGLSVNYIQKAENDEFDRGFAQIEAKFKKVEPVVEAQPVPDFKAEAVKELEKIVEESGVPKENVIISSTPEQAQKVIQKNIDDRTDHGLVSVVNETEDDLKDVKPPVVEKVAKKTVIVNTENGFFAALVNYGFQQLNLTITKSGENKVNLIVKPQNFSGDTAYDEIKPLTISGTVEELDAEFFNVIGQPLVEVAGLMTNAKTFIEEAEAKEKETKAKKAEQDKIKKDVESAKKFYDKDAFDLKKSGGTALKKFKAILERDPKNKEALEYKDKIEKALEEMRKKNAETLL